MFEHLVEKRIQVAIARGNFHHLPGMGKPLDPDDDRLVPEHLPAGLRILKNAGLPRPELADLRELSDLQSALLSDRQRPDAGGILDAAYETPREPYDRSTP